MINLETKKQFLQWVIENVPFREREAYWLIDYLITHENILEKVRIVEHAETTPRGIRFADNTFDLEAFEMYKYTIDFDNAEQIFHEIRMNWQYDLFVEFLFKDQWKNELYLAVLEDNPHYSWNVYDLDYSSDDMDEFLNSLEKEFYEKQIRLKLDAALEKEDIKMFEKLSSYLLEE